MLSLVLCATFLYGVHHIHAVIVLTIECCCTYFVGLDRVCGLCRPIVFWSYATHEDVGYKTCSIKTTGSTCILCSWIFLAIYSLLCIHCI